MPATRTRPPAQEGVGKRAALRPSEAKRARSWAPAARALTAQGYTGPPERRSARLLRGFFRAAKRIVAAALNAAAGIPPAAPTCNPDVGCSSKEFRTGMSFRCLPADSARTIFVTHA